MKRLKIWNSIVFTEYLVILKRVPKKDQEEQSHSKMLGRKMKEDEDLECLEFIVHLRAMFLVANIISIVCLDIFIQKTKSLAQISICYSLAFYINYWFFYINIYFLGNF